MGACPTLDVGKMPVQRGLRTRVQDRASAARPLPCHAVTWRRSRLARRRKAPRRRMPPDSSAVGCWMLGVGCWAFNPLSLTF